MNWLCFYLPGGKICAAQCMPGECEMHCIPSHANMILCSVVQLLNRIELERLHFEHDEYCYGCFIILFCVGRNFSFGDRLSFEWMFY